ncbi:hypothetical protein P154DRAFT_578654 [Amniculicola lignicola CBS 123094]|uniref:Uncharacterized protein n=1 Tax=Amniculicola lignicola CBS 123094 TaxID=1392246 RepID=A0A6A5WEZ5_9PLEO|nr:hypothetical protein P154DRAFT_578654 [Amniculicola lignicola CBS 123094]
MEHYNPALSSFEQGFYNGDGTPSVTSPLPPDFHQTQRAQSPTLPIPRIRLTLSTAFPNLTGHPAPPPSPPISTSHPHAPIAPRPAPKLSWATANRLGNEFLCLPRFLRDRIWALTIFSSPNTASYDVIEVPFLKQITYPDVCEASDQLYFEGCQVLIQNAKFSLESVEAVIGFCDWLNEFDEVVEVSEGDSGWGGDDVALKMSGRVRIGRRIGYENARRLEFVKVELLERGTFKSMGSHLLRRCLGITHVTLLVQIEKIPWRITDGQGRKREVDIEKLRKTVDIDGVIALPQLETLKLVMEPFMAMQKKLAAWEDERIKSGYGADAGLEGFWGLKEWVEVETCSVSVECPTIEEIVPGYRGPVV